MRPDIEKFLCKQGWVFAGVSQPERWRQWALVKSGKIIRVAFESQLEDLALDIVEGPKDPDLKDIINVLNYVS